MSKKPDKELMEQLIQLGYTEADAEQTARDISETELFLQREDGIEPSPAFMQGLETHIRSELSPQTNRFHYSVWLKRVGTIAAAVAIVFIAIIAFQRNNNESTESTSGQEPEAPLVKTEAPELWELELVEFEEPVLQVDDLVISEVLELWTEAEWDIENLFGKENDHEAQITDYAGIRHSNHGYA
jgi:hypothetical protein